MKSGINCARQLRSAFKTPLVKTLMLLGAIFIPQPAYGQDCFLNLLYGTGGPMLGSGPNFSIDEIFVVSTADGSAVKVGDLNFSSLAAAREQNTGRVYYTGLGVNQLMFAYWDPATNTNTPLPNLSIGSIPNAGFVKMAFDLGGTLYAMDNNTPALYTINEMTGVTTTVTITNAPGNAVNFTGGSGDIAFDPNNPTIFYMTSQQNAAGVTGNTQPNQLYTVDISNPSTPVATYVGQVLDGATPLNVPLSSLAFAQDGNLYTVNADLGNNLSTVYRLDIGTAAATNIGSSSNTLITDYATLPFLTSTDLAVQKVDSNTPPETVAVPGQPISYDITVTNLGGDVNPVTGAACNLLSFNLADVVPAQVTSPNFTIASGGGTLDSATNPTTWTAPNAAGALVPPTGSVTLTLTGTVDPTATPGTFTNTINVSPPTGIDDINLNNNDSNYQHEIFIADVAATKTGPSNILPGGTITYTITVTNNGPSDATNVVIADQLPTGVTFVSASDGGTLAGNTITWPAISTLAPGAVTRTVTVTAPTTVGASFNNSVSSTSDTFDPNPSNNDGTDTSAQVTTQVIDQVDLGIQKDDGQTTAIPGDNITYTITVTNSNTSLSAVNSLTVTDNLPATIQGPTFTPSEGTYDSATGAWTGLNLAPGGSVTLTLTGTIDPTATGTLQNTATVSPPAGVTDPNPNNDNSDSTTLIPTADLSITKSDNQTTAIPGQQISYSIVVTNNGPSTVSSVTVTDSVPAAIQNPSFSASEGTYDSTTGEWTGLTLASGGSVTLTLTGTIDPTATGTLENTATVSPPSGVTDPDSSNDSSTDSNTLNPEADLAVAKTVSNTNPSVGDIITYTITVTNNGSSTATNVQVSDPPPSGLTIQSSTESQGSYNSGTGAWTVGTLANGASATLTVTARVDVATPITNTAAASADQSDPNSTNNQSSVTVPEQNADLQLSKTVNNPSPSVGQDVVYTITLRNNGPVTATNIQVTEQLPTGLTFVSANPSTGNFNNGTGIWAVSSLSNGAIATLQITATVNVASPVTNTVSVTGSDQTDPTPGNNQGSATVPSAGNPRLRLVKRVTRVNNTSFSDVLDNTADSDDDVGLDWPSNYLLGRTEVPDVRPGDEVEYTIYFLSDGNIETRNVQICDLVPLNQTFVENAFNNVTQAANGFAGVNRGMAIAFGNSSALSYTNANDGDNSRFIPAGTTVPVPPGGVAPQPCRALNTSDNGNGAVLINLGNIPNFSSNVNNSFGFIRFRARVD